MTESAQGYRAQPLTWRRLAGPTAVVVGALVVVAAVAETAGAVVAGRVAESPGVGLVWLLGALLVGATILDTAGRTAFSGVIGRAEGRLRADLLHAALHQPLPVLEEQAVGEVLDRVDDDARQLGALMRRTGWQLSHAALRSVLAWVVAGLTWWPAWFAFPVVAWILFAAVGFADDITVRIKPRAQGTRIDVRSASRIGRHDFGANAARIVRFLDEVYAQATTR